MSKRSEQIEALLTKAGINTRRVKALGSYVHVDSFEKYENALRDVFSNAGFQTVSVAGGRHMDGVDGFRMVFRTQG